MAAYLAQKLAAEGEGESVTFLNDIVAHLWPNINTYASNMIKEVADPMFKTMLPGPLASLHFTKIDLGNVPMKFSHAKAIKTDKNGIQLAMNVNWDGKCDIELDGDMIPAVGVEHVKLQGRLSVLLCPLINTVPLIGAAQVAFINPPSIKLDFTGAANVADLSMIDDSVREVILSIINSMATLPNRYLVTLATDNNYFQTFVYPLGMIRVTVEKAYGFAEEAKSSTKKFFSKLTRASPDCYAKVNVGAEEKWKTSTKSNTTTPTWNETHDFVVTDFDQIMEVHVLDEDVGGDDEVGLAQVTLRELIADGGRGEFPLIHKGEETGGKVSVASEYFEFGSEHDSYSSSIHTGDGKLCGLATILVGNVRDVKGDRKELKPSVKVKWGEKHNFQTAIKQDGPGMDMNNPSFDQNFRVPLSADLVGSGAAPFRISLLNGEKEVGGVDVPFEHVLKAPNMTLHQRFDVGGNTTVSASICLRGVRAPTQAEMPHRPKQ